MAGIPSWRAAPEAWDTVTLAGIALPGLCKVDVERERTVDVKKPSGADGAVTTDKGAKPAKVKITWLLWDDVDENAAEELWAQAQEIMAVLEPRPGAVKAPVPLDIAHPMAALRSVRSVVITKVDTPDIDDDGLLKITLECVEWAPPKPKATNTFKKSDYYDDGISRDRNKALDLGIGSGDAANSGLGASILRSDIAREEAKRRPPDATPPVSNSMIDPAPVPQGASRTGRPVVVLP
jgi:hypothetical protein